MLTFHILHHVLHHILEHLERVYHLVLVWVTTDVHLNVVLVLDIKDREAGRSTLVILDLLTVCIEVEGLDLGLSSCPIRNSH